MGEPASAVEFRIQPGGIPEVSILRLDGAKPNQDPLELVSRRHPLNVSGLPFGMGDAQLFPPVNDAGSLGQGAVRTCDCRK